MTRELLLHIGSHKTGTTTIQHALADQPDALAAQGRCVLICDARHPNLHPVLGPVEPAKIARYGLRLQDRARLQSLINSAPQPRIIASSENFSFFFDPDRIRELARMLEPLVDRVRVLVYLRRQDSHVISHHQEGAKPGREFEEQIFGFGTTAIPWDAPGAECYLDYNTRIGHWLDVFGAGNVTVRIYERARLKQGDAWHDFVEAAGLDPAGLTARNKLNTSLGLTKAKIGHIMNACGTSPDLRARVMRALPDDDRQMPARAEARRFYDRYRAGNVALNARLGATDGSDLFNEDFSAYPEQGREDWSEQSAGAAIAALLEILAEAPKVEHLREAARLAHEAGRRDIALALIGAAAALRPDGPLIRKVQAEIKAGAKARK